MERRWLLNPNMISSNHIFYNAIVPYLGSIVEEIDELDECSILIRLPNRRRCVVLRRNLLPINNRSYSSFLLKRGGAE